MDLIKYDDRSPHSDGSSSSRDANPQRGNNRRQRRRKHRKQPSPQSKRVIIVTGANDNLYMFSILKAVQEFIAEDINGSQFAELRLADKIEASRTLFREQKQGLRSQAVSVRLVEF